MRANFKSYFKSVNVNNPSTHPTIRRGEDTVSTEEIDTRDHVFHRPTCETWVVAYVKGDRLAWCGWPEGEAARSDCQLVRKATEPERTALLESMARGEGVRARYAQERLRLTEPSGG